MARTLKNTDRVLEIRRTQGLNVRTFLEQLGYTNGLLAKKIGLHDVAVLSLWKAKGFLPWAVYLAIRDKVGTPKFHQLPQMTDGVRSSRLPSCFAPYLTLTDLPEKTPPKEPAAPVPTPPPLSPEPGSPTHIIIEIRVVTPPQPAIVDEETLTRALAPTLQKLNSLEHWLETLDEQIHNQAPPHVDSTRPHNGWRPTKNVRRDIKRIARQDPHLARELAHQMREQSER